MLVLLLVAFVSGLLTIFAPCIWPILPIVLSTSVTGGRSRPLGVTVGILISFSILTLSLSYLVKAFNFDPDSLRFLAVLVISFLGLVLLIPKLSAIVEGFASRLSGAFGGRFSSGTGFFGGLVAGISLGIVWAPCAGPILATIAALSATRTVNSQVVLVTLVYMLGTGIPLFLFATFGSRLITRSRFLSPFTGRIQQIFGIIMITTASLIWSGYDKVLQARLLDYFPAYSNFLYKIEQTNQVQEQLRRLRGKEGGVPITSDSFLPDLGPAPEFIGISNWLNSSPLTLSSLQGQVVLVDFWTYTCINCIRTMPFVTGWYEKYKDQGFTVVGVHTPEFEFEKSTKNVEMAIKMFKIKYPVAQDNDFRTWNNYDNIYWPAKYLIDKEGRLRYMHFGEGEYEETERAIQSLIAESGKTISTETLDITEETPQRRLTPETYLGFDRLARFGSNERPQRAERLYTLPASLYDDFFALGGGWSMDGTSSQSAGKSVLELNFFASKVFLVITPSTSQDVIKVYLDNQLVDETNSGKDVKNGQVVVDVDRLYELIDLRGIPGRHMLRLDFENIGTKVFAFTFG